MKKVFGLIGVIAIIGNTLWAQWGPDIRLTNDSAASCVSMNNARCVAVSNRNIHVVWWDNRDGNFEIYYKRSTDNGDTWDSDIRLTNDSAKSRYPSIAVSGNNIHVIWEDSCEGNWEIYYKRSTDNGNSWGSDIRLTNDSADSRHPSVGVSADTIHVVWYDNRDGNWEIYYKRSANNGVTWISDMRLTNDSAESLEPSIAISGNNIHVIWSDRRNGNREIYYKRSTNNGVFWDFDVRLTNNQTASRYPSVAVSGTNIHTTWQDGPGGLNIYYKHSTDNGNTWSSDTNLTDNIFRSLLPSIAISGNNVHVVWGDERDLTLEIYYKYSTDNGNSWGPDTQLTDDRGGSWCPSVAVSGGSIHVVWYDNRDGNWEIYYKKYSSDADIEMLSIDEPGSWGVIPDTVWAGATYQPKATIRNNGPRDAVDIEVNCVVVSEGVDYISSIIIDSLEIGDSIQVTFDDDWTISETYSSYPYTMMIETTYPDDPDSTNNSKYKQYINSADVQVLSIDEPEELWAGAPYTPRVTVKNNSPEGYVTFYITCAIIGGYYSSGKTVNHLAAGEQTQVIFDSWTTPEIPCDTFPMEVKAPILYDPNQGDNIKEKTFINRADVTVVSIDEPPDIVLTGTTYTPKVTVKNSSPEGKVTFGLNYAINSTTSLTAEIDFQTIPLQKTFFHNQDSHKSSIGKNLSKSISSINIQRVQKSKVHKFQRTPAGKLNQSINPGIENFPRGDPNRYSLTYPEEYQLSRLTYRASSFKQMNGYSETEVVTSLPAGEEIQISFPDWTTSLSACENYDITATADIACDSNYEDNTKSKIIEVQGDAGISDASEPLDSVYVGSSYDPTVTLKNFTQGFTEAFPCSLYIEDSEGTAIYQSVVSINGLAPDEERDITFDKWVVEDTGTYSLYAASYLPCDGDSNNNAYTWNVKCVSSKTLDVGTVRINTPSSIKVGEAIKPDATVQNYGEVTSAFKVACQIGASSRQIYTDTVEVVSLSPDDTVSVIFKDWIPTEGGSYTISVKTLLTGDTNSANDLIQKTINAAGIEETRNIPLRFDLSAIKPNPFSLNTEIFYQLPHYSKTSLAIYDVSGELVKTFVNGISSPGYYSVIWNGRDDSDRSVAAGIYFVRLTADRYRKTEKVVLVK